MCWGCLCTVVYFEKGFEWFVVMYASTVAAVVLNSIRTALKSDIWPVRQLLLSCARLRLFIFVWTDA